MFGEEKEQYTAENIANEFRGLGLKQQKSSSIKRQSQLITDISEYTPRYNRRSSPGMNILAQFVVWIWKSDLPSGVGCFLFGVVLFMMLRKESLEIKLVLSLGISTIVKFLLKIIRKK